LRHNPVSHSAWVRIELCVGPHAILRRFAGAPYRSLRGRVSDSARIRARAGE
jgi:hypothetical protein